jgi:exosortase A
MRREAPPWAAIGAAIGVGLAVLCVAFRHEIASAVSVWDSSTAYGHCWLVLPICCWLLWERRDVLGALAPRPVMWPALLALPLALGWFLADWLGIMEGRQLALIGFAELLLLGVLGWRLWWALSPAFLYLVFLVPFGAFITPGLQRFTADFIVAGLRLLDIPFEADAMRITIPEGAFYVAEACAGLRFLIASIAFGVLYAVTMFRSPWRRAAFIAVSCVVPVVANGIRGLGIVLLGHALGSAQAGAADHLIYGWVFFSVVILLLALAGLPFRQAPAPALAPAFHPPAFHPPAFLAPASQAKGGASWPNILAACVPLLLIAAATPLVERALERPGTTQMAAIVPKVTVPADCREAGSALAGAVSLQAYRCGDLQVQVIATTLPPGSNPARVLDAGRNAALAGLGGNIDSEPWYTADSAPWVVLTARDTSQAAAYAVWTGGRQVIGGLRDRLAMARAMFTPRPGATVAIAVTVSPGKPWAEDVLHGFLGAQKEDVLF